MFFCLSQLENGCLLNATNAAYIRTCLMPNGNAVVAANVDGLSTLQDHQKPGFLLWSEGPEHSYRAGKKDFPILRLVSPFRSFLLIFALVPVWALDPSDLFEKQRSLISHCYRKVDKLKLYWEDFTLKQTYKIFQKCGQMTFLILELKCFM